MNSPRRFVNGSKKAESLSTLTTWGCVHERWDRQEWGARSPLGSEALAKEADRAEFRELGAGTRRSGT
jgi:hypothetical protein